MTDFSAGLADDGVLEPALTPACALPRLALAASALEELARESGRTEAGYARYHATMHALHLCRDDATAQQRNWLTSRAYPIEESLIPELTPEIDHTEALPPDAFIALVRSRATATGRLGHPLVVQLGSGAATLDDVRLFVFHNWRRANAFYELLADFARRLDVTQAQPLYRNLFDELGCGPGMQAHPLTMQKTMRHLGLEARIDAWEPLTAGQAYLNNRARCMRHGSLAWGWALCFCLECITSTAHAHLDRLFRDFGLPEEARTFYQLHSTLDVEHTREFEGAIAAGVTSLDDQRTFLRSVEHHQRLSLRYFDAIWARKQDGFVLTVENRLG